MVKVKVILFQSLLSILSSYKKNLSKKKVIKKFVKTFINTREIYTTHKSKQNFTVNE